MSTGIAWTDETWNPTRGCSRVSEGCRHCYAERVASRFSGEGMPYEGLAANGRWTGAVRLVEEKLDQPLRWRRPRRIFVNSMSDLFHEALPDEAIDPVFGIMALAERHTFQVLTKRPERMRAYMTSRPRDAVKPGRAVVLTEFGATSDLRYSIPWPPPNVHLGVSVEDQATADARIPVLLQTPAAVRWVSAEPLLGPIDFTGDTEIGPLSVLERHNLMDDRLTPRVDWVVVGGESGPGARPCDVAWIRSVVNQCREADVPVFVKQLGARPVARDRYDMSEAMFREADAHGWTERDGPVVLRLADRKGGDPGEWPEDLLVREFPR